MTHLNYNQIINK